MAPAQARHRSGEPATPVGEMRAGDHLCLPYINHEERHTVLTAFLNDGLRAGHALVYLVDGEPAGAAAARLRDGFGVALGDGRLVVLPTAGTDLDGVIESALARGHPGVRVTAEASPALRGWPGTERFTAFEDAVRRAVARPGRPAMALCQYDRRWFAGDHLREVGDHHGGRAGADAVFDDGVLTIVPLFAPPGLRLSGAIDESTLPALVEALRDFDDAAHLCLDLSGLDFCDLAGLRVLIRANETSTVFDRQVILRSMPGCVELMLRVSGWHTAPGIVAEAAV
ncbi:MEDS domain-containing protein [Spirillospora sp. NPDC048824]|uniref:MEDS domain-containing protein n=1 Tax=Spirillospora sp. NPDC048824 TaxID=3364526 RepID=UPI00371CEABC